MNLAHALELLALPAGAVAVAALARRLGLSAPLVLVVAGLAASFVPGMPRAELDPEFVLFVFLPPLLFSAAWRSSYYNLRENLRSISFLSVGLVLFTMLVIGYTAHLVVPGLPLPAAFVLGALLAPPDAVAAVSVAQRLGLPRRVVTILVGESLFNDATALTAFRVALAAAVGGGFSLLAGGGRFLYAALAGAAIGLALGPLLQLLRSRLNDPLVETAVPILAPFAAYLAAEAVHASGVIAVVVSGLYLGHRDTGSSALTRLLSRSFWDVLLFILESVVFLLIGLQLPPILDGLSTEQGWPALGWWALAVFLATVAARFLWIFLVALVPELLSHRHRDADDRLDRRNLFVLSWAGMRGVVSLAAAFAIPLSTPGGEPFPNRDLLLFLTFTTVLGTLLVQGATFPALIRRLGIGSDRERYTDMVSEAAAQHAAARAALDRLETAVEADDSVDGEVVARLRQLAEHRTLKAWERLGGGTGPEGKEVPTATYRRLRREMLAAEREVFIRFRNERRIDDEVLERVLHELDLEEALLSRD
ncbi:Na+/H+ antiporter [Actinomadura craniellae]|uniref:Na+/H+ antiporter n=1 Tax=Actinomadura craniellae TaxID=2231787 RepID=A0A365GZ04_9ACTN|nr:Na+/H+ antiporter [Actinomadura craniellae]RAY11163.1 Na+/H+ antiporter [Actinomadura craniellae]